MRLVQSSCDTVTETETVTDLLKVGSVRRRRLALISRFLIASGAYTRSFCEFIRGATVNSLSSVKRINPVSYSKNLSTAANVQDDITDSLLSDVERVSS